jgi:Histidine kinase-, DNA gyrase B-, and HSP90-like ATPase
MSEANQLTLLPTFGDSFLNHHAGKIITDPHYSIIELVANFWDAGANRVDICWPIGENKLLSIEDNGIGMTYDEFVQRWKELNYNRLNYQGSQVEFPKGSKRSARTAFGRNGIGRHAMFCFADQYYVETRKNGTLHRFRVGRSQGSTPFTISLEEKKKEKGHGTRIYTQAGQNTNSIDCLQLTNLIGSRFVADPEFSIYVNGNPVTLEDLEHLCDVYALDISGFGTVEIRRFDSAKTGRTSKQSGLAWWVNRRLVGDSTWEGDDGPLLDARMNIGKRITYVIEVDYLVSSVKPDWSGFFAGPAVSSTRRKVTEFVKDNLREFLGDIRKARKRVALSENQDTIKRLPLISQENIAEFAEEVQENCPTLNQRDLNNAVKTFISLEKSRSGYGLLEKLSRLDSNDLDNLDLILEEWTVADAKKVLDELRYRIDLISQLEQLVDSPTADELHDLQPLFERGLWIFGPEFESISFTSNQSLATVVKKLFKGGVVDSPKKRPDFVILPDSSIGLYSCDAFNENHEVAGVASVIIVELKKGGFTISYDEKDQAMKYAREIRGSGKVSKSTKITCYVLGASVEPSAEEPATDGSITVYPRAYNTVLKQAHSRTFNLLNKLQALNKFELSDIDLEEIVHGDQQTSLFSDETEIFGT